MLANNNIASLRVEHPVLINTEVSAEGPECIVEKIPSVKND